MKKGSGRISGRLAEIRPDPFSRLESLRTAARLLDSAFRIPGTSFRIGLDPILGLVPAFGDLASPVLTAVMLWQARDLGIPRVVQVRMLMNVAIDVALGAVPVVGDVFDAAWKANDRNMELLERHLVERPPSPGDRAFVAVVIGAVVALAALPFLLIGWLFESWL